MVDTQMIPTLSVSGLSLALKRSVETTFQRVRVKGEISGAKRHTSGHLYFTLKDEQAILDAVSWKGMVDKFPIKIEEGLEVICTGRLTTYPLRSKYQLIVDTIELSGEGTLLKLLEDRRRALQAEGLFDPSKKKPLPFLPRLIGLVTSPTGAVVHDILHRLRDRYPCPVLLWPVAVQGDGAAQQIATAINGLNALAHKPDVIIVARGGGSLEDLWAFNEECVVRAAAASLIPLISGVGHEPDVTLIDYAADVRAPTPTAAAERVVPVKADLLAHLESQTERLKAGLLRLLEDALLRLDDREERLMGSSTRFMDLKRAPLTLLASQLRHPLDLIALNHMTVGTLNHRLTHGMASLLDGKSSVFQQKSALLESYSYKKTLSRGFSLLRNKEGVLLTSVRDFKENPAFEVLLKDGTLFAETVRVASE